MNDRRYASVSVLITFVVCFFGGVGQSILQVKGKSKILPSLRVCVGGRGEVGRRGVRCVCGGGGGGGALVNLSCSLKGNESEVFPS